MKCDFCGGRVEWRGRFSNLTHTMCLGCGRTNCQTVDEPVDEPEENETEEQSDGGAK